MVLRFTRLKQTKVYLLINSTALQNKKEVDYLPKAPLKPCAMPRCPRLVDHGRRYCDAHTKAHRKQANDARPDYRKWYGHAPWKRARRAFLVEFPLCVRCEAKRRITPATEVDHIKPHKGDRELFWDRTNWQSLCKECHSAKTMSEVTGRGGEKVGEKSRL